ncbi:hypothetical protein [Aquipseudomonas alcaligenes]|uniref:hypothetical protein n=1 Tax=Aquipseudomonas alcaligenes TaxID=43263 RepID=UPI001F42CB42|nr:hypothetical protein [Pseudomonas alcaligenes]
MSAFLQKAKDSLHIRDVYLRDLRSACFDGFDPKYADDLDSLEVQTMHFVRRSEVVQLDSQESLLFRVFILLGTRWVDPRVSSEEHSTQAMIEAEFVAEYAMSEQLEKDCLDEFALRNASYHVWPYWRELLMSQCTRMHLPRLVMPTTQVAQNSEGSES